MTQYDSVAVLNTRVMVFISTVELGQVIVAH